MSGKKLSRFITLQGIVYNVLNDMGSYDHSEYKRLFQFAIRGFLDIELTASNSISVVYLTPDPDTGFVKLPDDYLYYTKIGYVDSGGNVVVFGYNENMALARGLDCGDYSNPNLQDETSLSIDELSQRGYYFSPHFKSDGYVPNLYGIPGGNHSDWYREDRDNGYIQFSSIVSDTVVLEYVSTGISIEGSTYIDRDATETLIAFVHWKRKQHDPRFTRGAIQDAKQDYLEEYEKLTDIRLIPTKDELLDAFYEFERQTMNK